jgi:hypothetical protein
MWSGSPFEPAENLRFSAARGSSGHRLFISASMITSKVICDDTYLYPTYRTSFCLSPLHFIRSFSWFLGWQVRSSCVWFSLSFLVLFLNCFNSLHFPLYFIFSSLFYSYDANKWRECLQVTKGLKASASVSKHKKSDSKKVKVIAEKYKLRKMEHEMLMA